MLASSQSVGVAPRIPTPPTDVTTTSYLFKLPGELRNQNYELVLMQEGVYGLIWRSNRLYGTTHSGLSRSQSAAYGSKSRHAMALGQTCQSLRRDCIGLFYPMNTFELQGLTYDQDEAREQFMTLVGPENQKALEVSVERHCPVEYRQNWVLKGKGR